MTSQSTTQSSQVSLKRLTAADIASLNADLEKRTPADILRWAHSVFGDRLGVLSSMQKPESVICHHLFTLGIQGHVDVIFVDTGVNFRETHETADRLESRYGLNIVRLHPERTMAEQTRDEGVLYLTVEGQKRCCALRKKEPLKQIVGRYDALIGGLRRSEGGNRADIPVLAVDDELNVLRIHPLVNFDDEAVDRYIREHEVIYNPLHDQGYPTISCDRCTSPVLPDEPARAGRWRHLANAVTYCNINPTDRGAGKGAAAPAVRLPAEVVEKILSGAGI